jgi:high-affinity iron transporter
LLSTLLITLREGLEASLIVSILAAYLAKTQRRSQLRQVWVGVLAAAGACLLIGLVVALTASELAERTQELIEGIAGVLAVVLLTWMIFWMRRHGRTLRRELAEKADAAIASGSSLALPILAFIAVGREGIETVLFLYASFTASRTPVASGAGAVVGLLAAIGLGYGIYKGGVHLNLRTFFQVTGGLIVLVAAGLLSTAVHAFNEAHILLFLTSKAWDVSFIVSKTSVVGTVLRGLFGYEPRPTVLQSIVYFGYLVPTLAAFYASGRAPKMPSATAPASEASRDAAVRRAD